MIFCTYNSHDYWSEKHAEAEDLFSSVGYSALGQEFNRISYQGRRIPAIDRLLSEGSVSVGSILETGVGTGVYARLWERFDVSEWVGVDISEVAVKRLQEEYPEHEFYNADISSSQGLNVMRKDGRRSFDVVTAIDILYHITEDSQFARALMNLGRCVAPGGVLVVTDVFTKSARTIAPHVRRRPLRLYRQILTRLGFVEYRREPILAVMGDPVMPEEPGVGDVLQNAIWRLTQKAIRSAPRASREVVGGLLARLLLPIDSLLCSAGVSQGVNLEAAAFRRTNGPTV